MLILHQIIERALPLVSLFKKRQWKEREYIRIGVYGSSPYYMVKTVVSVPVVPGKISAECDDGLSLVLIAGREGIIEWRKTFTFPFKITFLFYQKGIFIRRKPDVRYCSSNGR